MTDTFASSLDAKHQALETEIDEELKRPVPDQMKLSRLKKEKLLLKEKIEGLASA